MREFGIGTAFHYVPLHSSPAGQRFGRTHGSLAITERTRETLVRLPLWAGLGDHLGRVLVAAELRTRLTFGRGKPATADWNTGRPLD